MADFHKLASLTHGMSKSPEYRAWGAAKNRCYNKNTCNYHRYGGRGIKMCDRWVSSFENFFADMGLRPKGLTLERNDTDGDYSPDNCRWATHKEQNRNRRSNRHILLNGRMVTLVEAAEKSGIAYTTLVSKVKIGATDMASVSVKKYTGPSGLDSVEEIAADYKSGMTMQDVADKYGISPTVVWKRLKLACVERRRRGHKSFQRELTNHGVR